MSFEEYHAKGHTPPRPEPDEPDEPEPLADGEVAFMKPNGAVPSVYHTNIKCGHIKNPENADRDDKNALAWDIPECSWCADGANNTESDHSTYQKLVELGEADDQEGGDHNDEPDAESIQDRGIGGTRTW